MDHPDRACAVKHRKDGRIGAYRTVDATSEAEAIEVATAQLLRSGALCDPMDGEARLNELTGHWDCRVYVHAMPTEEQAAFRANRLQKQLTRAAEKS